MIINDQDSERAEDEPSNDGWSGLDLESIRRVMILRRALLRSIDAMLALRITCIIAIAGVMITLARLIGVTNNRWVVLGLVGAVLTLLAVIFWAEKRRKRLTRQLHAMVAPGPTRPPDFTSLGDGSTMARRLKELSKKSDEDT